MILKDALAIPNLFIMCSLIGFSIEFMFKLMNHKTFMAALLPAILFSPLYGLALCLFLIFKPISLPVESTVIVSALLLLEAFKRLVRSHMIPNLPAENSRILLLGILMWTISFLILSEQVYPRVKDVITDMPFSCSILFIYSLFYIVFVYLIQKGFKKLNEDISNLEMIDTTRTQVQTARNELIHGLIELDIHQEEFLEEVHEECKQDMTDLDRQFEEILLQLSPLQQKIIRAYPSLIPDRKPSKEKVNRKDG